MNKKGGMVLRDIIFLVLIFSGIVALSSIFVTQMGITYENTNMTSEFNQDALGEDALSNKSSQWNEIAIDMNKGGLLNFFGGVFDTSKAVISEVLLAPATFSNIMISILEDLGVDESLTDILRTILTALLYVLIAFAIISAFLQGGKL